MPADDSVHNGMIEVDEDTVEIITESLASSDLVGTDLSSWKFGIIFNIGVANIVEGERGRPVYVEPLFGSTSTFICNSRRILPLSLWSTLLDSLPLSGSRYASLSAEIAQSLSLISTCQIEASKTGSTGPAGLGFSFNARSRLDPLGSGFRSLRNFAVSYTSACLFVSAYRWCESGALTAFRHLQLTSRSGAHL